MDATEFAEKYRLRVRSYARQFCKNWGRPQHLAEDLEQACWEGILEVLPYWKESDGSRRHRSPFNWCAGAMRRQMERVLRVEAGLKPKSTCKIEFVTDYEDFDRSAGPRPDLDAAIDLKRAFNSDPKPAQVARFVLTAINPNEQSTVARVNRITRQAVCQSVRSTRERLRLALA